MMMERGFPLVMSDCILLLPLFLSDKTLPDYSTMFSFFLYFFPKTYIIR